RCPTSSSPTTAGRGAPDSGGWDAIGYADCNDPALFLGESEGTLQVTVPLDDHVTDPRFYDPMTDYLLHAAGLLEDEPAEPAVEEPVA
ncbi:Phosphatase, partial [Streptomyces sp. Ncost-T6T-2b]